MPRLRLVMVLSLVLVSASSAHANGAMGLGLEMFDLHYWFAYVVATVLVEAWLIGRYLNAKPLPSLICSLVANLITGLCGGVGCLASFLHYPFVGNAYNPQPFLNAVALLTIFAIPSAVVEMIIWDRVASKKGNWENLGSIVFVHLITIPLALAILLIPARPYRGLESQVRYARRTNGRLIARALTDYVGANGCLPKAATPREIVRAIPRSEDPGREMHEESLYKPVFGRFSVGDPWAHPFEVNPQLVGYSFTFSDKDEAPKWVWYVRDRDDQGNGQGLVVDVRSGKVEYAYDKERLGY